VTVDLEPLLAGPDAASQLLPGCPAPHPRRPLAVGLPIKLEAKKGKPPFAARAEPTEAVNAGLLRGNGQAEFVQPPGKCPVERLRFLSILKTADKVIRIADDVRLSLTVRLHHLFKPQVQRIVQVDVRQNGRDHAALRCPGVGVIHGTVPFQYSRFEPGVDQSKKRFVVDPLFQHPQQPAMVDVVEEAFDVRFHDIAITAKLQLVGEIPGGVFRSLRWPVAITSGMKVVLVDRFQQQPHSTLQQSILDHWNAQRSFLAVSLGNVFPPNQPASILSPFETLYQPPDVVIQRFPVLGHGLLIYPRRPLLVELSPGTVQQGFVQVLVEILESVSLVSARLRGYRPQDGWLVELQPYIVRRELPLRTAYVCHPLPHVIGPTVSDYYEVIRLPIGLQDAFPFLAVLHALPFPWSPWDLPRS